MAGKHKLYILIRTDNLTPTQQAVQAGHAVAEFCLMSQDAKVWYNEDLIYLSIEDEKKMIDWMTFLYYQAEFTVFHDRDFKSATVACYTDQNWFDKLPLWNIS